MNKENICGYIYMIENAVNGKKYIGKTVNITKRMNRHKNDALRGVNKHLYNSIRKHGLDNFVYYIVEEAYDDRELNDLEIYYISLYDTFHGYGYNETEGGDGFGSGKNHPLYGLTGEKNHNFGRKRTEEWKEKHRKRMTGEENPFYGKSHTAESKAKISEAKKGIKLSEEHKRKIKENHADVSGEKNGMAKSVIKLSKDGEFIAEYKTVKDGANSVNGDSSPIVKCCKGKQKSAYGYRWEYK